MKPTDLTIQDLTPAEVHALVARLTERALIEDGTGTAPLVRVTGRLGDAGVRRGQWFCGVPLTDDGGSLALDIPANLARARKVGPDELAVVTGTITLRPGRPGTFETKLVVADIMPTATSVAGGGETQRDAGKMTVADLKALDIVRRRFPVPAGRPLEIALIHSQSLNAQVTDDCGSELLRLGKLAKIISIPTNMTNATAIADSICRACADVVMLIRGGGDAGEFGVFDDRRVVTALAKHPAYRVIGLGHSANTTLLDLVADFSARTPAQAGQHVREEVEWYVQRWAAAKGTPQPPRAPTPPAPATAAAPTRPALGTAPPMPAMRPIVVTAKVNWPLRILAIAGWVAAVGIGLAWIVH